MTLWDSLIQVEDVKSDGVEIGRYLVGTWHRLTVHFYNESKIILREVLLSSQVLK